MLVNICLANYIVFTLDKQLLVLCKADKIECSFQKLDWEVELAVVMGKTCRNVLRTEALQYVFGYTIAQDISARDWQSPKKNNGQWLFAKSMDTFCPLGPAVVVKEVFGSPNDKNIKCTVNGSVKQNSNTNDLIYPVEDLIAFLSQYVHFVVFVKQVQTSC